MLAPWAMNESLKSDPPTATPPMAKRQEFVFGVILIVLNSAIGFVAFKLESSTRLAIAVAATVGAVIAFCMRKDYGRQTSLIIAVFGILSSAIELTNSAKRILWAQLTVAGLTFYWLRRDGVKAWFPK
jgi:uncharacterized membrane protein HdeD (DUF308 family)